VDSCGEERKGGEEEITGHCVCLCGSGRLFFIDFFLVVFVCRWPCGLALDVFLTLSYNF
jgi:hypothetical protein